jgi:hypothetical protein
LRKLVGGQQAGLDVGDSHINRHARLEAVRGHRAAFPIAAFIAAAADRIDEDANASLAGRRYQSLQ